MKWHRATARSIPRDRPILVWTGGIGEPPQHVKCVKYLSVRYLRSLYPDDSPDALQIGWWHGEDYDLGPMEAEEIKFWAEVTKPEDE